MKIPTIILNSLLLLFGAYWILAAYGLESESVTITEEDTIGAYYFAGGVIAVVSPWNIIYSSKNK